MSLNTEGNGYVTEKQLFQTINNNTYTIGTRFMQRLKEDAGDVSFLVVGDSTGNDSSEWPHIVLNELALRNPTFTVKYSIWSDGGSDYPALTTIQTGTGANTLTLWNCCVAGQNTRYQQAPNFDAMIAVKQPDLIFINHGHNEGGTVPAEPAWRDDLLVLTESINRACPMSEIVLIAQNPRDDGSTQRGIQGDRRFVTQYIAKMRGYGFVNVWQAFMDASPSGLTVKEPSVGALLLSDGIHPNSSGEAVWAATILNKLQYVKGVPAAIQQPSSFSPPVTNLLANGDFSDFTAPPTLPSWTATNTTLSKNVTNFESPAGWSVRMQAASAAQAKVVQSITGNAIRNIRGQWVTLAARYRIPTGSANTVGRVGITQTGGTDAGSNNSNILAGGVDDFLWVSCSRRIGIGATSLDCILWCDSGTAGTADVSCDRAILAKGILPRDVR